MVIVRDILGLADKGKEAKSIIKMGEVHVDGKPRKDHKYPVGLMDVVSIPKMKMNYRIVPTYKGLKLIGIDAKEAKKKLCKIDNKISARKKKDDTSPKFQLNLHDGRNILIPVAGSEKYTVGDSIIMDPVGNKILDHLEFEEGALAIVVKGKNIGLVGEIEKIMVTKTKEPTKLIFNVDGDKIEVIKDYVFVIGRDSPVMKLTEE